MLQRPLAQAFMGSRPPRSGKRRRRPPRLGAYVCQARGGAGGRRGVRAGSLSPVRGQAGGCRGGSGERPPQVPVSLPNLARRSLGAMPTWRRRESGTTSCGRRAGSGACDALPPQGGAILESAAAAGSPMRSKRICAEHYAAAEVSTGGKLQRFCQQVCGRACHPRGPESSVGVAATTLQPLPCVCTPPSTPQPLRLPAPTVRPPARARGV